MLLDEGQAALPGQCIIFHGTSTTRATGRHAAVLSASLGPAINAS